MRRAPVSNARIFANLFSFWVEFYLSKTLLNIYEYWQLTNPWTRRCRPLLRCIEKSATISMPYALNASTRPLCYITSKSKSAPAALSKGLAAPQGE